MGCIRSGQPSQVDQVDSPIYSWLSTLPTTAADYSCRLHDMSLSDHLTISDRRDRASTPLLNSDSQSYRSPQSGALHYSNGSIPTRSSARLRRLRDIDPSSSIAPSSPTPTRSSCIHTKRGLLSSQRQRTREDERILSGIDTSKWHKVKQGTHFIYADEYRSDFQKYYLHKWWRSEGKERYPKVKGSTLSFGNSTRTSWVWDFFDEVIEVRTGKPSCYCKCCNDLLAHTGLGNGPKHLQTHLHSASCRGKAISSGFGPDAVDNARTSYVRHPL